MTKNRITFPGLTCLMVLTLAACSPAQTDTEAPVEPVSAAPASTPPLDEPDDGTAEQSPAEPEEAEEEEEGQPQARAATGGGGPQDVSEFATGAQQSAEFPEPLTSVPDSAGLVLAEVRTGVHEGYDRIVFEHAGQGAPGWRAEYVSTPVEPGSGFPLQVEGEKFLYISAAGLSQAGSEQQQLELDDWTDTEDTVFEDVVTTFVHNGRASYYLGLDTERKFRVSVWEHQDGPRLIIDVLH
ncbi:hypothetical protein HGQ17_04835 [Nesterenkonia sp. MY13]|uniref:AMIN-like domain-containing protein n=1 Tax=Nesterenkonia sedimenti TaxID=1463632 RepID=A0A7X8TIE6_9MICC|nr:hypothetical protein [Nesterenkonia sedimenti]NLS09342.1 hypothetical protein [Nesterenkonia sedimenti]